MKSSQHLFIESQRSAMRYDRGGDAMYDAASALMKSLRGSDPDAALHYLARFLEAGGPHHPLPAAAVLRQRGCMDAISVPRPPRFVPMRREVP